MKSFWKVRSLTCSHLQITSTVCLPNAAICHYEFFLKLWNHAISTESKVSSLSADGIEAFYGNDTGIHD